MNNYFIEVVQNLNILPWNPDDNSENQALESISDIIQRYDLHPSIIRIKEKYEVKEAFLSKNKSLSESMRRLVNLIQRKWQLKMIYLQKYL